MINNKDYKALTYILAQTVAMRDYLMENLIKLSEHSYDATKEIVDCELYHGQITDEQHKCAIGFINAINS